ncbi:hypothetical protein SCLCIDRAFT_1221743 [Scleroderma citrinum Foug A]|uniref:Uncharacterized protein n=1 Tax=Scleroderma citrinum Foug A TaxID=1036808 RepID=A0A0C2YYP8_9AGAM|nr:hypothetical protein SCLCIDRAFT_1221743 [Scleroderma citrinum Foug A]
MSTWFIFRYLAFLVVPDQWRPLTDRLKMFQLVRLLYGLARVLIHWQLMQRDPLKRLSVGPNIRDVLTSKAIVRYVSTG